MPNMKLFYYTNPNSKIEKNKFLENQKILMLGWCGCDGNPATECQVSKFVRQKRGGWEDGMEGSTPYCGWVSQITLSR